MADSAPIVPAAATLPQKRVDGVDAYRGFVMFLMMAEVLQLPGLAKQFSNSAFWRFVGFHTSHVDWAGCSLHDLIQPSFSFLVGVALPFSIASRLGRGDSLGWLSAHALWRSLVLVMLGIFLRSIGQPRTNFIFTDTLTQIGLGYFPLFLIGLRPRAWHWAALVVILVGYWAAFAFYPLPPADFDYPAVGVPADWSHHATGFAAHWNKNSNLGWAFDTWWMNLFPRETPFTHNPGGYLTLSFIPTLATMILGLIAGGWIRDGRPPARTIGRFLIAGVVCLAVGVALDWLGLCPSVKRIWTPSWTLFSGGWCFLMLAGFYGVVDAAGVRSWSLPLRVIGANSIAAYVMAHLLEHFIMDSVRTHLGSDVFRLFGKSFEPQLAGVFVLTAFWLILYWMYRRKIFLKV